MAMISYPFESVNTGTADEPVYDRAITAEDERTFNKMRYTNGVFSSVGDGLSVSANNSMTVTVGTGGCHIEGAMMCNTAAVNLELEAADTSLKRIDRIVARLNLSTNVRSITLEVKTGTAATNPVPKDPVCEPNYFEIVLADVYVKNGTTSIGTANITDQRLNSALCGFVVAAIPTNVDTTGLFDQYQASLNEWLETVASALDGTLAGNLQSQITTLNTSLNTIAPNGIVDFAHGGTNANNAADARQNLNYIGVNPIASIEEDTPANWVALGTGVASYNLTGQLTDQPAQWGFIFNMVNGNDVRQMWFTLAGGDVYHRGGNANGWEHTWRKILDENSGIQIIKLWKNASPTSSFAAQRISLDLSEYTHTIVLGKLSATTQAKDIFMTPVGETGMINFSYGAGAAGAASYYRAFNTSASGIEFTGGNFAYTSVDKTDNAAAIPYIIYGIKGVQ